MNNRLYTVFTMFAAIVIAVTIIYWIYDTMKHDEENLNIRFSGKVESVYYDIKQFPTVMVNKHMYYIGSGYVAGNKIEVGDSIIKERGFKTYKLIKHKSHEIIEFNK